MIASLTIHHPEEMKRSGMRRLSRKYLMVSRRRPIQVAGQMTFNRGLENLRIAAIAHPNARGYERIAECVANVMRGTEKSPLL